MASPDAANVTTGPGKLWSAPIGTAEPTTRTAVWPAGWTQLGFTSEGHTFDVSTTTEDVEVAELVTPIKKVTTKRDLKVAFALAEITLAHLKIVLNGGTTIADGAIGSIYEPPAVGTETRIMLGWDSEDLLERVIWRRCFQGGSTAITRKKGTDYAKFPAEFSLETPTGVGVAPFRHFFELARVAA